MKNIDVRSEDFVFSDARVHLEKVVDTRVASAIECGCRASSRCEMSGLRRQRLHGILLSRRLLSHVLLRSKVVDRTFFTNFINYFYSLIHFSFKILKLQQNRFLLRWGSHRWGEPQVVKGCLSGRMLDKDIRDHCEVNEDDPSVSFKFTK